ncbi:hypothetical protein ACFYPC_18890 [Streptomyces sp. NPDC005808]|uniref:hypothetical protein n=1 Tax=Streptomyces sp. NPDC005808 TaxID=3364734 RepID=UPI00368C67B9
MAEHEADRDDSEEKGVPLGEPFGEPLGDEQSVPFDEEAAWQAIVSGYGEEPKDPPGAKPFKSVEDLALLEPETNDDKAGTATESTTDDTAEDVTGDVTGDKSSPAKPVGSSVAFAPGVAGPRDFRAPEPADEDFDEDDEGHFVPPEPPPLPAADTTAKFAWLAVLGGPVLLLLAVLLGWDMTWWLATLGIGGFLGGFATLVTRMKSDDEDGDDPGRGAVV